MKVIYGIGQTKKIFTRPVLAIGVFDGVHLGHQYLIKQAVQKAKALNGTSIVMTFFPHPSHILRPEDELRLLTSLDQRLKFISQMNVDFCYVIPFTRRFSGISAEDFLERYIVKAICPREVFVGRNFKFGKNRKGHTDFLKEEGQGHGFKVNVVPPQQLNGVISSTRIRKLILQGKVEKASRLLGRKVFVSGRVIHGDGRGKCLGFPTANLKISSDSILPPGVYLVEIPDGKKFLYGMANIGQRPSFGKLKKARVEVHIFNFSKNIYGKNIEIRFIRKLRNEQKFHSKERLIHQLHNDQSKALRLLKNPSPHLT